MSKQDRQGVRTAAALERKYNVKKGFEKAETAEALASEAKEASKKLDEELKQQEIFNRLTNNGKSQGFFIGQDGNFYINASYIVALAELFAKNITMTGKFIGSARVFLPPGIEEVETMRKHLNGESLIPDERIKLYDVNGNSQIDAIDYMAIKSAAFGTHSLEDWDGAVKSTVTITIDMSNPKKALCLEGMNMWGREVEVFIGTDISNCTFVPRTYLDSLLQQSGENLCRTVEGVQEWFNPALTEGIEYRTIERWNGKAVYTKLINLGTVETSQNVNCTLNSGITALIRATPNIEGDICGNLDGFAFSVRRVNESTVLCSYSSNAEFIGKTLLAQIWYTAD